MKICKNGHLIVGVYGCNTCRTDALAKALDAIRNGPPRQECRNGHEFTPENTMMTAKGRRCLTCVRIQNKIRPLMRRGLSREDALREAIRVVANEAVAILDEPSEGLYDWVVVDRIVNDAPAGRKPSRRELLEILRRCRTLTAVELARRTGRTERHIGRLRTENPDLSFQEPPVLLLGYARI